MISPNTGHIHSSSIHDGDMKDDACGDGWKLVDGWT